MCEGRGAEDGRGMPALNPKLLKMLQDAGYSGEERSSEKERKGKGERLRESDGMGGRGTRLRERSRKRERYFGKRARGRRRKKRRMGEYVREEGRDRRQK